MGNRFFGKCLSYLLVLCCGVAYANTGTVTYIYTDPQGTPLAEADANGNITATFDYTPYGSQALGTPPNGPGYTGHVNDPDTGFVYMQARYYDPATGRFLSVDPVAPSAGSVFNFSRYAYGNNNPIKNTDPNGKQVFGSAQDAVTDNSEARANAGIMLMCGCDSVYTNLSGTGAVQSVVTPFEFKIASGITEAAAGGASLLKAATTAGSELSSSTALSTFRMTTPGETFFHYGFAADANKFAGGLRANGFATSVGNLSGSEAKAGLALPHLNAPDAMYTVSPQSGTWLNVNPVATPQFGQPGGLPEFQFPNGTGKGTVSDPSRL
jgi:RHS repeat-associated protein